MQSDESVLVIVYTKMKPKAHQNADYWWLQLKVDARDECC